MPDLSVLRHPLNPDAVLRNRRSLERELLKRPGLQCKRIAILGGSTTAEVRSMLRLFLLAEGIDAEFYESEYNAYYEEAMFEAEALWAFQPDIVLVHTTWHNVAAFPELGASEARVEELLRAEVARFESMWGKIHSGLNAQVIQNNFDLPRLRPIANLDASDNSGRIAFLDRLNLEFARCARERSFLLINDIRYVSAQVGLAQWFDYNYWYSYHMAVSPVGTVAMANNVASLIKAVYGKSRKCLVLDLDNTLWGGVIGDDGPARLLLGRDHPIGEAYAAFQSYVKRLHQRGVILAVCSKNEEDIAKEGFSHADTVLRLEDFSVFKANWNPKHENIREIAAELNIGLDSLVFVDDNPAERAIVAAQLPDVAVPDVGSDITLFAEILERDGYFEAAKIVQDDLQRAAYYADNSARAELQAQFANYGEFLKSLEMTAVIEPFEAGYLERITQLINKTNQFNLTTRRYTSAEVEGIYRDEAFITLYGRLTDRFGDNGLVSVIIARTEGDAVFVDTWLMSCRVLKREMEDAMFDALVEECQARGLRRIVGTYLPTKKNSMVAGHYKSFGFTQLDEPASGGSAWEFLVPNGYSPRAKSIKRVRQVAMCATAGD